MSKTDEIIQKSGVSRSTVFRFLRGDNVRPELRKSIIKAMDELGYSTKEFYLQNLVIEISVAKDFEKFKGFTEVIHGITERAEARHVTIQLVIRTGDQIKKDYGKWSENSNNKGIIIIGKDLENEEIEVQCLKDNKIPHIFVNRIIDEPDISYVAVDLRKAACDIVDYLIKKGHRKIATLAYPCSLRIDRDKIEGYNDAFIKNNLKPDDKYKFILKEGESSDDAIEKILNMEDKPTAFFGICDSYAMEFINKAHEKGLRVPEDIAVVGMDDLDIAQYFKPALTTVQTHFRKLGILAVDHLLQVITEDLGSIKTVVNHSLFIREST